MGARGLLFGLSQIVSEVAFRTELALTELGQRAAVAEEPASTLNRRGLDIAQRNLHSGQ